MPWREQVCRRAARGRGKITEKDLATLLATVRHLRLVDLTTYPFDPQLSRELKEAVATRYDVVPVRVEGSTIEMRPRIRSTSTR